MGVGSYGDDVTLTRQPGGPMLLGARHSYYYHHCLKILIGDDRDVLGMEDEVEGKNILTATKTTYPGFRLFKKRPNR